MKLADHTDFIRKKIEKAFINKLGRLGIKSELLTDSANLSSDEREERTRMETVLEVFINETGDKREGYDKLVEELTFTLFNRIAALKVMEAHILLPEVITRRREHGDRLFAHLAWLEQLSEGREMEAEGILPFLENQLELLSQEIPLFSLHHPYHLMPTAIEILGIILSFNQVELDETVPDDIWKNDDVLGWLYESYNNEKKKRHKDEGGKTEYNKVSIQSQVYTPRWVVKFLVDNSMGKFYLEMYPNSDIRNKYKIANAPISKSRAIKHLHEIKLIDPSNGSGNFLLYAFDLFYDLYVDQIENYDADYDKKDIPRLIIENNLYGVDLDDRGVQLAQLGLYIKAKRKKRNIRIAHFNVVSSDFFLPEYESVREMFEGEEGIPNRHSKIIADLWEDLQSAHKFGSLIRLEEKINLKWFGTKSRKTENQITMFVSENFEEYEYFRNAFFKNLNTAVTQNTARDGQTFINTKTQDAISYLQILTQKYDVAVANPPYTDSADFGLELKIFIDENYRKPFKFNTNLYAAFILRCCELIEDDGKVAMVHPPTFMYIKTFEDVRKFLIDKMHIHLFVEWGYLGMFHPSARVDAAMYILENGTSNSESFFIKLSDIYEGERYFHFLKTYTDLVEGTLNKLIFKLHQERLKIIEGYPFIYWLSSNLTEKFKKESLKKIAEAKPGLQTGNNDRFLRFWWELFPKYQKTKNIQWIPYAKGGNFNKWMGNIWLLINWSEEGEVKRFSRSILRNSKYYFREGITYSASGSRGGTSFRLLPEGHIFDVGGASIFFEKQENIYYGLALFNSKISNYFLDCLNPTANIQKSDIDRLPFIKLKNQEQTVVGLVKFILSIKSKILLCRIIEIDFSHSNPLNSSKIELGQVCLNFLVLENLYQTLIILSESIINNIILENSEISDDDKLIIEKRQGQNLGDINIHPDSLQAFINFIETNKILLPDILYKHIKSLKICNSETSDVDLVIKSFNSLYKDNNDFESFCNQERKKNPNFKNKNPIDVWYWFREAKVIPQVRAHDLALEFVADAIRMVLMEDEDGIIPLVGIPGESALLDRLEEYCVKQGFNSAQFMQLDGLIGRPINEYLQHHFFKNLSDHLNLFPNLPKTPFIWHLSSGPYRGFEIYIIIYKWNRDSLFRLKSRYINKRIENLEYRQLSLQNVNTAQFMNERELIINQLDEIDKFSKKVDELIEEGYDPILDFGVGKNIAPLQKKGMLRAEVLNAKQLDKYLNPDW